MNDQRIEEDLNARAKKLSFDLSKEKKILEEYF